MPARPHALRAAVGSGQNRSHYAVLRLQMLQRARLVNPPVLAGWQWCAECAGASAASHAAPEVRDVLQTGAGRSRTLEQPAARWREVGGGSGERYLLTCDVDRC